MSSRDWLEIGLLVLSTLAAPLGPKVVDYVNKRIKNKTKKPRRRNIRGLPDEHRAMKTPRAWLLYVISFSLDVLVGIDSYNRPYLSQSSTLKIGLLAVVIANFQLIALAASWNQRMQRRKDRDVELKLLAILLQTAAIARRIDEASTYNDGEPAKRLRAVSATTMKQRTGKQADLAETNRLSKPDQTHRRRVLNRRVQKDGANQD